MQPLLSANCVTLLKQIKKMNRAFLLLMLFLTCSPAIYKATAQKTVPDTVYTGIYVTSIHDIDFIQKEYTISLWLWLKYKNKDFDFLQNLEVPQAKTVVKSFSTIDTTGNKVYILMKLQCVMKDSWKIHNFPFDRQKLRLSIENSQFDSRSLIFIEDRAGMHFDPKFTLSDWDIDSFNISSKINRYETDFGDSKLQKPVSEYSAYIVNINIERKALDLFWKMFLGMYVAFLIAFVSFYIHGDSVESRFGLAVGSIFAVVGNKYTIDSVLPESSSFTLVDTLHGITLLYVFAIIVSTAYSLNLVKRDKISKAKKFDMVARIIVAVTYILFNIYYISRAVAN